MADRSATVMSLQPEVRVSCLNEIKVKAAGPRGRLSMGNAVETGRVQMRSS